MKNIGYKNHPYIPNSDKKIQEEMLKEVGLQSLEDLHAEIPKDLKLNRKMNLPEPYKSEYELVRGVDRILNKNMTANEYISFLGGGCWNHYVPAICNEINGRAEFLSGYAGEPYNDHGRFQSLFEYESLLAELIDMEVVNVPTFDWAQAAATGARMASRIKGREMVLVNGSIDTNKLLIMKNYCDPGVELVLVDYCKKTGRLDLEDLKRKLNEKVAAVYFENPNYFGVFEDEANEIGRMTKENGSILIVGVDPISLGIVESPREFGADIIVGDLQSLGNNMNCGGSQSGFISTLNDPKFVLEFPSRLFGIAPTIKEGEYGFGDIAYDRTSFGDLREKGKEYVGTQTSLIAITAGVYLSLMGPKGLYELGQNIIQKGQYLVSELSKLDGVKSKRFNSFNFRDVVVDFSDTGKTIQEINEELLKKGIFGGIDLSEKYPELKNCALFSVTEVHFKQDIDQLIKELSTII